MATVEMLVFEDRDLKLQLVMATVVLGGAGGRGGIWRWSVKP